MLVQPAVLENDVVRLEPLEVQHAHALGLAASDGQLWTLSYTSVPSPESVATYIDAARTAESKGQQLPFVIRHRPTGQVLGSTRYLNIAVDHKRLEIGSTWIARSWQGTVVNPACKLLLLEHAFVSLRMNRIEFQTHARNAQSRRALAKLGATEEGTLRHHRVMPDGSLRDSVVFSIIAPEWPALRRSLEQRIADQGAVAGSGGGFSIRPYRESDEAGVVALWNRCGLVRPWNDPVKDIQRKLKVDRDLFLVGTSADGEVIATAMAGYEGHRGWINYLAVDPAHQRRGYARQLMNEAERLLRLRGCPKINLQVRHGNDSAADFYRSVGYVDEQVMSMGKRLEDDERQ